MGRSKREKEALKDLNREGKRDGFKINKWATHKVSNPSKKRRQMAQRINLAEYNVEVVNEYTYLGTRLTNKNEELAAVQVRMQDANRAYLSTLSLMKCNINCKV
jgi:hypothetical protein